MTTVEGLPSMSKESEEIFDSECFKCSQDGRHVEAEVFCVECGNMCSKCLQEHNQFPILRDHQTKDKSAVTVGTTPTEKCLEHDGRLIDTFCSSHDAVCCSVCVTENHRSCPDVSYIPKVASGISSGKELQDTQTSTETLKARLNTLKKTRQERLEEIRKQRNDALERAAMYKDELIQRIEELGKKTAAEITDKYRQLEDSINGNLDELSQLAESLEDLQSQLKKSMDNENKLFVHLKQCKSYISAGEKLTTSDMGSDTCTFETDSSIEAFLNDIQYLGMFIEYSAVHLSDEICKSSNDSKLCRITGICQLDDGEFIISDYENKCLKKLNESFQIVDRCALPSPPWDVCQTSPKEVAVTMRTDKKIQFVSVGQTLSLTRSFTTPGDGLCNGIACRDGTLYVSREIQSSSSVQLYNLSGVLLKVIQKDKTGTAIFDLPLHIKVSAYSSNTIVTDCNKGLIILDKSGQLVTTVTDPDLKHAYGLCVLPGEQVLVCGFGSNNIIQFDAHGKKVRTLLTAADGLKKPETLHFDRDRSQLVVGMRDSDTTKVYNLVKK